MKFIQEYVGKDIFFPLMIAVVAVLMLAGCGSLGPSAAQIKEMKGTSSSMCVDLGPTIYSGAASVHYTSFGGGSVGTAGGGGKAACGKSIVDFENQGKLVPGAPIPVGTTMPLPVGTVLAPGPNGVLVVVPKP